jgi:hypothetical protein
MNSAGVAIENGAFSPWQCRDSVQIDAEESHWIGRPKQDIPLHDHTVVNYSIRAGLVPNIYPHLWQIY